MTPEFLAALFGFAFVTVATPGPNNLMLMASGANFGMRRSVPHMLGIGLGFPAMLILVGLGAMQVFDIWPVSYDILKVLSVVYMLWLAWKIANAAPPAQGGADGKTEGAPLTFLQAAAFQWVNPKAWSMALSANTLYAGDRAFLSVLLIAVAYILCSIVSTTIWTGLGVQVRRLLARPRTLRLFNIAMALLLLASLVPALMAS
ncbi:LysE family translocator [Primorskyibacter sp. S187A]|uniref:LysE family translocator n=1 Tax=Primorskyibacter sp. S187A TaxID=3415130 RepID=UPI003C7EBBED